MFRSAGFSPQPRGGEMFVFIISLTFVIFVPPFGYVFMADSKISGEAFCVRLKETPVPLF